jgi:hypothetical protein
VAYTKKIPAIPLALAAADTAQMVLREGLCAALWRSERTKRTNLVVLLGRGAVAIILSTIVRRSDWLIEFAGIAPDGYYAP